MNSNNSLAGPMRKMADTKTKIDAANAALKQLNEEYRGHQREALSLMEENDIQNLKFETDGNGTFTAFQFPVTRAKVSDADAFEKWSTLVHGEGSINGFKMWSSQKITSACRELLKDEEASLPDGVSVEQFQEVRLRKE